MRNTAFAIIGAGPAGLYTADRLLKDIPGSRVDVFEKNPVPMGLVRNGIAPDHPASKRVGLVFDRILDNPRLRLFTNVRVGVGRGASSHADIQGDLTLSELRAGYTAVIIATGSSHARKLAIPGSDAVNFHNSDGFTAWYNSAPQARENWDLTTPIVAVIGGGNVALDVARMLLQTPDSLAQTDVAPQVIDQYVHNAVTEVHIFVRRGPAQARWIARQLRDIAALPSVTLNFDEQDFVQAAKELEAPGAAPLDRDQRAILHLTQHLARQSRDDAQTDSDEPVQPVSSSKDPSSAQDRQVYFHFYNKPIEVPTDDDGEVTGLITDRTHIAPDGHVIADGEDQRLWHLSAVYSAIGYEPDGLGPMPRDPRTGALLNRDGRLIGPDHEIVRGVYAAGWAASGAQGFVPAQQADARRLAAVIAADLEGGEIGEGAVGRTSGNQESGEDTAIALFDPVAVLRSRGVDYGDLDGWHRVEQAEKDEGAARERRTAKIADPDELRRISAARDAG